MTALSARRRQVREFARAVETGKAASDLAAPLRVVTLLRQVPPVEPDPAFVADLREELLSAAKSRSRQLDRDTGGADEQPSTKRRSPRQQRALAIAASTLVIVAAGTGAAAVSRQALPGDLLYPAKRSIERVELQLARGDSGKGNQLLDEASTRLDELEALTAEAQNPDAEQTAELTQAFNDFTSETTDGGRRLMAAYATDNDVNAIGRIRVFTTQAAAQLTSLVPAMPSDLRTSFTRAATTVGSLDALAVRICPTCGGPMPLVSVPGQVLSPGSFLSDAPNVDLSDLPSSDAGGSQPVTLPGGPPVTEIPSNLPTNPSDTTSAGPTASGVATAAPTSGLTTDSSEQSSGGTVAEPSDVLTPVTTLLPEDLPTIVITIPDPQPTP